MDIRKIEKKDYSWDSYISYGISEMTYKVDNDEPMEEPRIYPITLKNREDFLNMVKEIAEFNQNSKRISRTVGGKFYTIKNIIILN